MIAVLCCVFIRTFLFILNEESFRHFFCFVLKLTADLKSHKTGNANDNSSGLPGKLLSFSVYVCTCVMTRICSILLLAEFAVLIFGVFCKDLQSHGIYRRSLSNLNSKILSNRANTLISGGEMNHVGKY